MFIVLKKNVYLVKGKKNACLYDFNTYRLYHLEKIAVELLESILNQDDKSVYAFDAKTLVNEFLENGLLEKSNEKRENNIHNMIDNSDKVDFAWIEITTKCNLYCVHCYDSASPFRQSEMDWDIYLKVMDFVKESGIKKIQFIGGEPLLQSDMLKKMICAIRDAVDFIEVFTNAVLIDDDWAEFFVKMKVHVAVSVYSYCAKEHDKVTTVIGSHSRTNVGIAKLAYWHVPYRVCTVLMKNIFIGSANTSLYTISTEKDVVRMAGRADFHLLSEELIKKRLITEKTFSVSLNPKLTARIVKGHNCFGHKVYISAEGDVFPCVMERRWTYGNLRDSYTSVLREVYDQNVVITKNDVNSCKECEFRYDCFDCRPNSLDGRLETKPWYCTYIPEEGRWIDEDEFIRQLVEDYSD